jgi:hypothetical protein
VALRRIASAFGKLGAAAVIAAVFAFGLLATVYLSIRSPEIQVPEVVNKSYTEGEATLEKAGLDIRERAQRYKPDVQPGIILDQSPRAGEIIKAGQTIAVVVSRGPREGEQPPPAEGDEGKKDEGAKDNDAKANENSGADSNKNENANRERPRNKNRNANRNANAANLNGNANNRNGASARNSNQNANRGANSNRTLNTNTNASRPRTTNANTRNAAPAPARNTSPAARPPAANPNRRP